jgi:hypothetical protein
MLPVMHNLALDCKRPKMGLYLDFSSARIQQSSNALHSTRQTAGSDWFFEYYGRECFKLTLFLLQQTLDSDWSVELQVYYINVDIYAE